MEAYDDNSFINPYNFQIRDLFIIQENILRFSCTMGERSFNVYPNTPQITPWGDSQENFTLVIFKKLAYQYPHGGCDQNYPCNWWWGYPGVPWVICGIIS